MVNKYYLVNPQIKGDNFENSVSAKNSIEAAKKLYNGLSTHFSHNVMKFYFTLQKGDSDKYSHFQVSEKRNNDKVKFQIQPYILPDELTSIERFKMKLADFNNKFEEQDGEDDDKINSKKKKSKSQDGGRDDKEDEDDDDEDNEKSKKKSKKKKNKKKESSSSESSSSSDDSDIFTETLYKRAKRYTPISQPFYYWWYDALLYNTNSLFIPTFYPYVYPYIEYSWKIS